MLTLRETDRLDARLPRYLAYHGLYRMGLLSQIEPIVDRKRQPAVWEWRITCFPPLAQPFPDHIRLHGIDPELDAAVAAMTDSWQGFLEWCDIASGVLRFDPQPGQYEGFPEFNVIAGGFELGRLWQEARLKPHYWPWHLGNMLPSIAGTAETLDEAKAQAQRSWRVQYEMLLTPLPNPLTDQSS